MKKLFLLLFTCFLLIYFYSADLRFSVNYNDDNYCDYTWYGNEKHDFFCIPNSPDRFDMQLSRNIKSSRKFFKDIYLYKYIILRCCK